jgi:hypothetical protein
MRHAEAMWRSLVNLNGGPFASVRRCRSRPKPVAE